MKCFSSVFIYAFEKWVQVHDDVTCIRIWLKRDKYEYEYQDIRLVVYYEQGSGEFCESFKWVLDFQNKCNFLVT